MSMTIKDVIHALEISTYSELTGSRKFIGRTHTDWDFVADGAHRSAWESWLKGQGFRRLVNTEYMEHAALENEDTIAVWERKDKDAVVQVVLSRNYEGKKRIINWLAKRPDILEQYYKTTKKERHKIWNYLHKKEKEGAFGR